MHSKREMFRPARQSAVHLNFRWLTSQHTDPRVRHGTGRTCTRARSRWRHTLSLVVAMRRRGGDCNPCDETWMECETQADWSLNMIYHLFNDVMWIAYVTWRFMDCKMIYGEKLNTCRAGTSLEQAVMKAMRTIVSVAFWQSAAYLTLG